MESKEHPERFLKEKVTTLSRRAEDIEALADEEQKKNPHERLILMLICPSYFYICHPVHNALTLFA